jgi:hypothetical protein
MGEAGRARNLRDVGAWIVGMARPHDGRLLDRHCNALGITREFVGGIETGAVGEDRDDEQQDEGRERDECEREVFHRDISVQVVRPLGLGRALRRGLSHATRSMKPHAAAKRRPNDPIAKGLRDREGAVVDTYADGRRTVRATSPIHGLMAPKTAS